MNEIEQYNVIPNESGVLLFLENRNEKSTERTIVCRNHFIYAKEKQTFSPVKMSLCKIRKSKTKEKIVQTPITSDDLEITQQ